MKLFEEFKLYENMWYNIDDAIAAGHSNTIFALVEYWQGRNGEPETIRIDAMFVDKAEALERFALRASSPLLGKNLLKIDLVQFTNLSVDEIDNIRAYKVEEVLKTAEYVVLTSTGSKSTNSTIYRYYYVVCLLEEFFSGPRVLASGTIKVDITTLTESETPEERAMTDYFDSTEIAYSDDWDDDMWDNLYRYVYEIDENTYNTEAGLPKTDADIIKYVEESTADYEE